MRQRVLKTIKFQYFMPCSSDCPSASALHGHRRHQLARERPDSLRQRFEMRGHPLCHSALAVAALEHGDDAFVPLLAA